MLRSGKNDLYTGAGFKYKITPIRAVSSGHRDKIESGELLPGMTMRLRNSHPSVHANDPCACRALSLSCL
jgi:hypothetical protein